MPMKDSELVKKVKACLKLASDVEAPQREREIDDLRFQVPELQWTEESRRERQGGRTASGDIIPPRPMLSISLLTQPLQLIRNQAANARLGVEIHPVSERATMELAEIKQGLYRRIERDSHANVARLWALDRAVQAGRGFYRVNTQWDEDGDDPFDQEITIQRILDQAMVYMDPSSQEPDCSDARWGIIAGYVPLEVFEAEYKSAQMPENEREFDQWIRDDPEWVKQEEGKKAVLVAEYFYKDYEFVKLEMPDGTTRTQEIPNVKWAKLSGKETLEKQDWNGRYIPIVPVIGRELQVFDGERRWEGMVRQARDGQRFVNYAASNMVERMALEPKVPWIMAEGQDEGYEDQWAMANVRNWSVLKYKPTTVGDQMAPPPQRAPIDSSGMSLAFQAFQAGKDIVQSATAVFNPSLGAMPQDETAQSGRAILALQQQADAGTGHFLQNLAEISMMYEAKIVLDLMPKIYDRPGRVTQILGEDGDARAIMLGAPFIPNAEGPPQPVPMIPGMPLPDQARMYDLNEGKYSISVSVGKSFQTRLQEGQAEIQGILEKNPQWAPIIGPEYFKFRDFPGAAEIGKLLAKIRDQQFPGITEDEEGQMSLPQAMQMIQQLQQQMQEQGQAMQQMQQALDTEQAKQQATLMRTQMETQNREVIARLNGMFDLMREKMKQEGQANTKIAQVVSDNVDREDRQAHEASLEVLKGARESAREAMVTVNVDNDGED